MDTSAFFAKKRQELQRNNPQASKIPDTPWWQDPELSKSRSHEPAEPTGMPSDFSKANHLRGSKPNCPNCGSEDFMKPTSSTAARCFDCGYIQGREVNDLNTFDISADAKTVHVRQTADGGAKKYRARISKNANDIRLANAELEQSYMGKLHVDS